MSANDTVELEIRGTVYGQRHITTLHFRYLDLTSNEQGLIDDWQANGRTLYRGCFRTDDLPVELLVARQVCGAIPLRAPVEESEAAGNQAGTRTISGDRQPSWLASCTNFRTAFAGKSRRGRTFLGGLQEGDCAGNDLTSGARAAFQSYFDGLMTRWGPSGTSNFYRLVVYSRKLASVPNTQCQDSSTVITSMLTNLAVATQKSRKVGSGT